MNIWCLCTLQHFQVLNHQQTSHSSHLNFWGFQFHSLFIAWNPAWNLACRLCARSRPPLRTPQGARSFGPRSGFGALAGARGRGWRFAVSSQALMKASNSLVRRVPFLNSMAEEWSMSIRIWLVIVIILVVDIVGVFLPTKVGEKSGWVVDSPG
jgi:hypothetical protein